MIQQSFGLICEKCGESFVLSFSDIDKKSADKRKAWVNKLTPYCPKHRPRRVNPLEKYHHYWN